MNRIFLLNDIQNYVKMYKLSFSIMYTFIILIQLIILYIKKEKRQFFLFILHKVIILLCIILLMFYYKNILGFYLYIIATISLCFIYSILKKERINFLEFFLMGDINLIVAIIILLYSKKL